MKNRIDELINTLQDFIQTGDGSPNSQYNINDKILSVIKEINKVLRTRERDLR